MFVAIWHSFRRLPLWVQIWVAGILVPVNLVSLAFWTAPFGWLVACLAVGGMLPNLAIMLRERGLSKRMAVPHLMVWGPLVGVLVWLLMSGLPLSQDYARFLWLLLAVDGLSLAFDIPDAVRWYRGDRDIA